MKKGKVYSDRSKGLAIEYEYDNLEGLYDMLGEYDVITANEIHDGDGTLLLSEGEDLFILKNKNINELKETGKTTAEFVNTLDKYIDKSKESHRDFMKWLRGEDSEMGKGGKAKSKKSEGEKFEFKELHDYGDWHDSAYYAPIGYASLYDEEKDKDRQVDLGVIASIANLEEIGDSLLEDDPEYKYVVDFEIVPAPYEYSKKFLNEVRESFGDDKGWDKYVKNNPLNISDEAHKYAGGAGIVLLEEISVGGMEEKYGKQFSRKDDFFGEIKFRRFKTGEEAEEYIKSELVKKKLQAVSGLIGFQLDKYINRAGQTGWDRLKHFVLDAPFMEKGGKAGIETIRDLAKEHPEMYTYHYKWRKTESPELEKDLEEVLREYGYQIEEEDRHFIGQYNDLKGYLNLNIEPIMEKGGKVYGKNNFWDSYANDGLIVTGGSLFPSSFEFGGTLLGGLFGLGAGYMMGAASKQKGYPTRIMERDSKYYKWSPAKGWVEFTGEEYYALTEGNLYKYNFREGYHQLKIFERGGSTTNGSGIRKPTHDRMFNFLKDDLEKLEKAISEGDKEEIERFFSYWGYHLKSLKTKANERMYNFLKDDLEKLEKAISEEDKEEIERFFSYWNYHLKSLEKSSGGSMAGGGKAKSKFKDGDEVEVTKFVEDARVYHSEDSEDYQHEEIDEGTTAIVFQEPVKIDDLVGIQFGDGTVTWLPQNVLKRIEMAGGGSVHKKKYGLKKVKMTSRGRSIDSKVKALPAGWRKSKQTGKWYFESRQNRADKNPRHRLESGGGTSE